MASKIDQKIDAIFELKNVRFGGQNGSKMGQKWGQNELHKVPKRELNWEVSPGTPGGAQKEPKWAKNDPKWSPNGAENEQQPMKFDQSSNNFQIFIFQIFKFQKNQSKTF